MGALLLIISLRYLAVGAVLTPVWMEWKEMKIYTSRIGGNLMDFIF